MGGDCYIPITSGTHTEKTLLKIKPIKHRYSVVQRHLFSFAQQGFSQSGKPPQGVGTLSKPRDTHHPRSPIAGPAGLREQVVDLTVPRFPVTKPNWGCYKEMPPKKPRAPVEPGSYEEAVLNFKTNPPKSLKRKAVFSRPISGLR